MENLIINVEEEHIKYRFQYKNNVYVLISFSKELIENEDVYFAKQDVLEDGTIIIRNIESDSEFKEVKREFKKQMIDIGEDEDDEWI